MMLNQSLLVSIKDKIATLTLNRPDCCNALDGDLIRQLYDAFSMMQKEENVQVILLKGNGKHFCAGADIGWMKKQAKSSFEQNREDVNSLAALFYQMHLFSKPIVALAQGSILGGGLGLLACSDIVITAEDAFFCFSEVKIGLIPAIVSPYVVRIIGERAARYYFLTGDRFNAIQAQHLGLAHRVIPLPELENEGAIIMKMLLNNSPLSLTGVKRLLLIVTEQKISWALAEKTADLFSTILTTEQAREGLDAFMEKRPPI